MRVVVTHDITDDTRTLEVPAVRAVATVIHRVQDAPVHGLEAVADLRQRPADDDRHRVVEVRPLHLDFDTDGFNPIAWRRRQYVGHAGPSRQGW